MARRAEVETAIVYDLVWRGLPWLHANRAGERCRIIDGRHRDTAVFEFADGSSLEAPAALACRLPRVKWKTRPKRQLRERIYKAADYTCARCGFQSAPGPDHDGLTAIPGLQVDHIVPLARGGTNDPTNLQVLCEPCNRTKGAKL